MSISLQLNATTTPRSNAKLPSTSKRASRRPPARGHALCPPVRKLATELGVTRLTVQNAYSELQSGGWIEGDRGAAGTLCQPERATAVDGGQHGQQRPAYPRKCNRRHSQRGARGGHAARWRARRRDNSLLHAEEFWACFSEIQRDADGELFSYESTQGNPQLRIGNRRDAARPPPGRHAG